LKFTLAFGLVEKQAVDVFDGRRVKVQQLDRGLHRFGN